MKAGRLGVGEMSVEKALANGSTHLVIIASDASANTLRKFVNKCHYYNIPMLVGFDRETISKSIGRQNRTSIAVMDHGFAKRMMELADNDTTVERYGWFDEQNPHI